MSNDRTNAPDAVQCLVELSVLLAPEGFAKVVSMLDPEGLPELLAAAIGMLGEK